MNHVFAALTVALACLGPASAVSSYQPTASDLSLPPISLDRSELPCLNDSLPIYNITNFAPGWLSGSRGTELDTTEAGLVASVAPFSEMSFRRSKPFCDDAVLDMVMQGNVLSRASVVLYSSQLGAVSAAVPLWSATPDAVLKKKTLGGTLRVVGMERDFFRVSVNLKAVDKNRDANPEDPRMWDTILIRDDSGRGFRVMMESAVILPDQPMPSIKDGTAGLCVGSVCNVVLEDVTSSEGPKRVPLFGYVINGDDDKNNSYPALKDIASSRLIVNGRLPVEGFSRRQLVELCESIAATSLGACSLDEIDDFFVAQDPSADVHWPVVSIEANSFDDLTAIRELAYGAVQWMEVNEFADGTSEENGRSISSRFTQPPYCSGMPWGLERIQRQDVPDGLTGQGVRVYVLDTGVSPHPEFGTRLQDGFNCETGVCTPGNAADDTGHGTHVAGIIAGECYGIAPGAEIVSIKVLDGNAHGGYNAVIAGLKQSVYDIQSIRNSGAQGENVRGIVNLSLGGPRSTALNDAVKRVVSLGVPVITSAGNDGFSNACTLSPSSAPAAVCVSATNSMDHAASFSNIGSCVDIWAPGRDIVSANYDDSDGYSIKSGTSQATPHVTGTAALVLQAAPRLKPREAIGVIYGASILLDLAPDTTRRFLSLGQLAAVLSQVFEYQDPVVG